MRKAFVILIFIFSSHIYGQTKKDNLNNESKLISYYLISNSCDTISDWYEKKDCSRKEIENSYRKGINKSDLTEKLKAGKYRIWNKFMIDQNGDVSEISINTDIDNSKFKTELKNILKESIINYRLIDENGLIRKGRFSFPIYIYIEE